MGRKRKDKSRLIIKKYRDKSDCKKLLFEIIKLYMDSEKDVVKADKENETGGS